MAIRDILIWPHPILATKAEPVEEVTDEIRELVADMMETMYDIIRVMVSLGGLW